jgi:hypothetical protein
VVASTEPTTTDPPTTDAPAKTCAVGEHLTPIETCAPDVTTTLPIVVSREARLAAKRCIDAAGSYGLGDSAAKFGPEDAEAARDLCDEANTQLDVDGLPVGSQLGVLIADRNVDLSFLILKIVSGDPTAAADGTTYDGVSIQWRIDAQEALDELG